MVNSIYSFKKSAERNLFLTNLILGGVIGLSLSTGFYLNQKNQTTSDYSIKENSVSPVLSLLLAGSVVGLGLNFKKTIPGLISSKRTKSFKNLSPDQIEQIETELKEATPIKFFDRTIFLTNNWFVYRSLYDVQAISYQNIERASLDIIKAQTESLERVHASYLLIFDRAGNRFKFNIPSHSSQTILSTIESKLPSTNLAVVN